MKARSVSLRQAIQTAKRWCRFHQKRCHVHAPSRVPALFELRMPTSPRDPSRDYLFSHWLNRARLVCH